MRSLPAFGSAIIKSENKEEKKKTTSKAKIFSCLINCSSLLWNINEKSQEFRSAWEIALKSFFFNWKKKKTSGLRINVVFLTRQKGIFSPFSLFYTLICLFSPPHLLFKTYQNFFVCQQELYGAFTKTKTLLLVSPFIIFSFFFPKFSKVLKFTMENFYGTFLTLIFLMHAIKKLLWFFFFFFKKYQK